MTFVAIDIGTCFEVSGIEDVGVGGSRRQGNEVNLRRFFLQSAETMAERRGCVGHYTGEGNLLVAGALARTKPELPIQNSKKQSTTLFREGFHQRKR